MINPIKMIIDGFNEACEYNEKHPHYVDGVKQASLRTTTYLTLGIGIIALILHFFF